MVDKEGAFWSMDHIVRSLSLMSNIQTNSPNFAPEVQIACYSTSLMELNRLVALRDDWANRIRLGDSSRIDDLKFSQLRIDFALKQLENVIAVEMTYQSKTLAPVFSAMSYVGSMVSCNPYNGKIISRKQPSQMDLLSKIRGGYHGYHQISLSR